MLTHCFANVVEAVSSTPRSECQRVLLERFHREVRARARDPAPTVVRLRSPRHRMPICRSSGNVALGYSVESRFSAPDSRPRQTSRGSWVACALGDDEVEHPRTDDRSLLPMLSIVQGEAPPLPVQRVVERLYFLAIRCLERECPFQRGSVGSVITPALES